MKGQVPIRPRTLPKAGRNPAVPEARVAIQCRFFARNKCERGADCVFLHDKELLSSPVFATPASTPGQGSLDSRSQLPCKFFLQGTCRNGESCPYNHASTAGPLGEEIEVEAAETEPDEQTFTDDWVRKTSGGLVHYEDGAAISKISFPSDFSAVHLRRLPAGSSQESIAAFLKGLGSPVSSTCIRVFQSVGQDKDSCSADVRVEDPLFAKTVRRSIAALRNRVEAVPIETAFTKTAAVTSGIRVSNRNVHVSWYRPTRTVWLNFGTKDVAERVKERCDSGVCTILGRAVIASGPRGSSRNRHNPLAWTLLLDSIPAEATVQDIERFIPAHLRPRDVELGEPSYGADKDFSSAAVRSMLTYIGPLDWWQLAADAGAKRIKARARFVEEADARQAAKTLDNAPLSFGKNLRLTVQLVTSAKFRVLSRIYDISRPRIEPLKLHWKTQHLRFTEYPSVAGHRALKIESEQSQDVATAKSSLEAILAGTVAESEDRKALWCASFAHNGASIRKLKGVESKLGVVVLRDRRKSQLRVFGPEKKCEEAIGLIAAIVENDTTSQFSIQLTSEQFEWACRGGFRAVSTALGGKSATFDIVSSPKRILIAGTEDDYKKAVSLISSGLESADQDQCAPSSNDCSVCWCPADEPTTTKCGHEYCADCFENLCHSDSSSRSLVRCKGNQDTCKKILPLDELQGNLDSSTFEAILEESLKSHIRRHPLEFRYCPTPGCEQIYRVGIGGIHACTQCLVVICRGCHNPHDGMTCDEFKDQASGGQEANRKLKQKLGIKDCPKCKTSMEKTEGCNHMTCGGCNAHICWVCMQTFVREGECYAHMNKAHGGIGLDYAHIQ